MTGGHTGSSPIKGEERVPAGIREEAGCISTGSIPVFDMSAEQDINQDLVTVKMKIEVGD